MILLQGQSGLIAVTRTGEDDDGRLGQGWEKLEAVQRWRDGVAGDKLARGPVDKGGVR